MKPIRFQISSHSGIGACRRLTTSSGLGDLRGVSSISICSQTFNNGHKRTCTHRKPVQNGICLHRAFHQQGPAQKLLPSSQQSQQAVRHSTARNRGNYTHPYTTQTMASSDPVIHDVFETKTSTWQYIVADPSTLSAVIIDPVLDFDPATQQITTQSADALLSIVKKYNYNVVKILETHAHADHLTAAAYLQRRLTASQDHRPSIAIGKRIGKVQDLFGGRYGVVAEEYKDVFDKLFEDDEKFDIGSLEATAIHLPGHTPDHLGYKIGDNVFCGDSLFHPDIGTARCDFPGGSASDLFNSGRKLLALPDHVKIWTGHDYPPTERQGPVAWMSVAEHKEQNKHLKDGITEGEFVALRRERDSGLAAPRLLHQSLQVNVRGGQLPKPNEVGHRMLHVPLKLKDGAEW